ncbi:MAG: hypothetical protein ACI85O_001357 [Saprospiraceae bacterium]|jgi:hypothetical protein
MIGDRGKVKIKMIIWVLSFHFFSIKEFNKEGFLLKKEGIKVPSQDEN